jgi:hypothetical protein
LAFPVAILALAACGGGDSPSPIPEPVAGDLTVSLVTPNSQDGALLLRIVGAAEVKDVRPVGNYRASFLTQGAITRVVITGDIAGGDILKFRVPDVGKASSYVAFVEQAASRTTYALLETGSYVLTIRK